MTDNGPLVFFTVLCSKYNEKLGKYQRKTIPDPPPVINPPLCSNVSIRLSIKPKIGISIAKMLNIADNKSL